MTTLTQQSKEMSWKEARAILDEFDKDLIPMLSDACALSKEGDAEFRAAFLKILNSCANNLHDHENLPQEIV